MRLNIYKKIIVLFSSVSLLMTSFVVPSVSGEGNTVNYSNKQESNYVTGYLDKDGLIKLEYHPYNYQNRSLTVTVAVFVGKVLVGYVTSVVVDGIIVSVTGRSGTEWAIAAINSLVGRRYRSGMSVSLSCSIYPPHSYEGARCRRQ